MRIHRGPGTQGRALLALHDMGEPQGGAVWRNLLEAWPGPSIAPDLRGHGGTEPPEGGAYASSDTTLDAVRALERSGLAPAGAALPPGAWREARRRGEVPELPAAEPGRWPIVVGRGWSAWGSELLAAADRASAVVLVDGLGGPWLEPEAIHEERVAYMRAVLEDEEALAFPSARPDPVLRHGFPSVWERGFVEGVRARIGVPVLALETPGSPTPVQERKERLAAYRGPVEMVEVADGHAATVATHLTAWIP